MSSEDAAAEDGVMFIDVRGTATLPLPPQNRFVEPTCPESLRQFIP